jgi:hypothetical protein
MIFMGRDNPINFTDLNNKLFCTFTTLEGVNDLVDSIQRSYTVMYSKIFVLEVKNNNEYVLTYNIEMANIASIPENTILVHRKKESNTLYTINALNEINQIIKWWCSRHSIPDRLAALQKHHFANSTKRVKAAKN